MTEGQKISEIYHSLFSYKLSKSELLKWEAGPKLQLRNKNSPRKFKQRHFEMENKFKVAKEVALFLRKIPSIQFVGITGSLAMNNASPTSDIDLMIITTKNTLWLTRLLVLFMVKLKGLPLRKAKDTDEKDKLCFNLWVDEAALEWHFSKNAYIAHEIAQVIPLVNKNMTHQNWITRNSWIYDYWPHAVQKFELVEHVFLHDQTLMDITVQLVNGLSFTFQRWYMRRKRTREYISLHEAYFHPYDWGEKIIGELKEMGVTEHVR